MKDHVENCHLTKLDVFTVNRDQVMDFETWFQTIQLNNLKMFCQFCDNCKILSFTHNLKEA